MWLKEVGSSNVIIQNNFEFENVLHLEEVKNKMTEILNFFQHIEEKHIFGKWCKDEIFKKKMEIQSEIINDFCKRIISEVFCVEINSFDSKQKIIWKVLNLEINENDDEITITKKMQDKYIKELIFIQDIDEAKWFLNEVEASIKEIVNVYRWNELTWATEFSAKFRELWEQDTTKPKEFFEENLYNDIIIPILWKM